jgi:hypothetical protein
MIDIVIEVLVTSAIIYRTIRAERDYYWLNSCKKKAEPFLTRQSLNVLKIDSHSAIKMLVTVDSR